MSDAKPLLGEDTIFGRLYYQDTDYAALEAERDALRAELARWVRSYRDVHEPALQEAHAYIQELRAEVDGLREDAERYRYLRNTAEWPEAVDYAVEDGSPGQMDAAIDAALSADLAALRDQITDK